MSSAPIARQIQFRVQKNRSDDAMLHSQVAVRTPIVHLVYADDHGTGWALLLIDALRDEVDQRHRYQGRVHAKNNRAGVFDCLENVPAQGMEGRGSERTGVDHFQHSG